MRTSHRFASFFALATLMLACSSSSTSPGGGGAVDGGSTAAIAVRCLGGGSSCACDLSGTSNDVACPSATGGPAACCASSSWPSGAGTTCDCESRAASCATGTDSGTQTTCDAPSPLTWAMCCQSNTQDLCMCFAAGTTCPSDTQRVAGCVAETTHGTLPTSCDYDQSGGCTCANFVKTGGIGCPSPVWQCCAMDDGNCFCAGAAPGAGCAAPAKSVASCSAASAQAAAPPRTCAQGKVAVDRCR